MGSVRARAFRMRRARDDSHAARGRPSLFLLCCEQPRYGRRPRAARRSRHATALRRFRSAARIDLFAGPIGRIRPVGPCPSAIAMTLIQLRRRAGRRQAQRARPSFRARRRVPRIIDGTGSISKGLIAIHYIENRNNRKDDLRNAQERCVGRRFLGPAFYRGRARLEPVPRVTAPRCPSPAAPLRYTPTAIRGPLTTATASRRSTMRASRTAASNRDCPSARNAIRESA